MMRFRRRLGALFSAIIALAIPAAAQAAKSGVSPGVISLPKGPGSVSGLGESFKPDLNTGSMTYRVPLKVPAGVGGLTPSVALSYSSGGGNSEVGFGWSLGIPKIQIRTEKGLPKYNGSDIYTISGVGSGELVPLANGFYRLEIEGAYIRAQQGPDGWEVRDKSGKIYRFGYSVESRTEDNGGRVFAWYLTDQYDTLGNHIEYVYEQHGGRPYLRLLRYNNFSADVVAEVEFTYEARSDALASYRAGFKVTLGQRLVRIESSVGGQLLARYTLEYDGAGALSRLARVTMVGTDGETGLPSLTLSYYAFDPDAGEVVTMSTPPGVSPGGADNTLADLNGDSFPDLLITSSGNFEYYLNDGGTGWLPRDSLPLSPSVALSSNGVQLADVDGDGRIDLLAKLGPGVGDFRYYPADDAVGFAASVPLTNNPDFSFEDPEVRLFDVTGDGRADVVRTTVGELLIYENLGGGSYADGQVLPEIDSAMQVMFSDTQHVHLADMNGDGLIDVVYLRSDSVVYWPQMGGGRFDQAVTVGNTPTLTDMAWVKLRDLNGDGLGDLVRVGVNQVEYWLNQGDGSFGALQTIVDTPYRDPINTTVDFADMNGNGSTDIVWIDVSGSPTEAWQYLDIMGSNRPGLLHEAANGLGQVLRAEYSSSGAMSAQARLDGDPWTVEQPVPTQVVSRLTVSDSIGPDTVTEFEYRDGHYNGEEREFRGFGETRQRALGDEHTPSLITTVEFDVGWLEKARKGLVLMKRTENEFARTFQVDDASYDVVILGTGTDGRTVKAARRRDLQISVIEGSTEPRTLLTQYEWDDWGNVIAKYEWGEVVAGDPLDGNDERITLTDYAVNEDDWILNRVASRQLQNALGEMIRWERRYYDGGDFEGLPFGQVSRGYLKRREVCLDAAADSWITRKRLAHDEWGNVIAKLDARGYENRVVYDTQSHRFPVEERLELDDRDIVFRAGYDQKLGLLVWYRDPNDNEIRYQMDPLGRLRAVIKPGDTEDLPSTRYEYSLTSPVSTIKRLQRVRSGEEATLDEVTFHDGRGRLVSRKQPDDNGGWVETVANRFDARGNKALVYSPRFVGSGNYAIPEPGALVVTEYRDALSRTIRRILPDGSESRSEYGALAVTIFDENDSDPASPHFDTPTRKIVDGLGRPIRVEENAGSGEQHIRRYEWDSSGNLLAYVDVEGSRRQWVYDGAGRRIQTIDPDAGTWNYEFDDDFNETRRVDPLGRAVRREYDGGGRLSREILEDENEGEIVNAIFHYDEPWDGYSGLNNVVGKLGWVEDQGGIKAYGYDSRGRTTVQVRQLNGKSYAQRKEFDTAGRITALVYPDDTRITYRYNARSLVTSVGGMIVNQEFGAGAQLLRREYGNGVIVDRGYDDRLRLTSLLSSGPDGATLQDFQYSHDRAGNVMRVEDRRVSLAPPQDHSVEANYDALNRLKRAQGNGYDIAWEYRPGGNISRVTGTLTPDVKEFVFGTFHYGEQGDGPHALSRIETSGTGGASAGQTLQYAHDIAGNLTEIPGYSLRYDAAQRVTEILGSDGTVVQNTYDFSGARILRNVNTSNGGEDVALYGGLFWEVRNGELVKYVVIGKERVARIGESSGEHGTNTPASAALTDNPLNNTKLPLTALAFALLLIIAVRVLPRRNIYHITSPIVFIKGGVFVRWVGHPGLIATVLVLAVVWSCKTGSRNPDDLTEWPSTGFAILTDHLGSVHLLVDAQGDVQSEQAYLPYGTVRYSSSTVAARYGYTGKEANGNSGIVAIGMRSYLPGVGQWSRPDPLFLHDPTLQNAFAARGTLYQYSLSNPLSLIDENGLAAKLPRRSDLVKQLRTQIKQDEMKTWIKAYHRPRTDKEQDRCHNDLAGFLRQALGTKKQLVANYSQIWRSSLHGKQLGKKIWTAFNDRIKPNSSGDNWTLSIRKYGGAGWQKHIRLKPGMTIHYSRDISAGRFGHKHIIMWLGKIPGKSGAWYFDSLPGKIREYNSSSTIFKDPFFRVTRVNDPWQGKE